MLNILIISIKHVKVKSLFFQNVTMRMRLRLEIPYVAESVATA